MTVDRAVKEIANELDLNEKLVLDVYLAYWKAIKKHITDIPMRDGLTEQLFNEYRPTVTIPSMGKLACPWNRYCNVNEKYEYIRKAKNGEYKREIAEGGISIDEQDK